jgi:hypothetical protein
MNKSKGPQLSTHLSTDSFVHSGPYIAGRAERELDIINLKDLQAEAEVRRLSSYMI